MSAAIAVIDFETTGMTPAQGARATEVAIVLLEQGRVVDRFQSLMQAEWMMRRYRQQHVLCFDHEAVAGAAKTHRCVKDLAREITDAAFSMSELNARHRHRAAG